MTGGRTQSKGLVLTAMIFAVAMTFIDQTIVSIAVPDIQRELSLSSTGIQWVVNAYLLTLASFFAFGGRLADTAGHRKMVVLGVVVFAVASTLCGLTPTNSLAEAWIITFRAVQGIGGALMFPAALAIVVQTFPLKERGRALAAFFGAAGALTAIGPLLGGYLTEWTWRAIFWVNIPVAVVALILISLAKPATEYKAAPLDLRGLVLIVGGVGLSVFGFQQAGAWGWGSPAVWLSIAAGIVLLVVFALVELRTPEPLTQVRIFAVRPFLVENLVLALCMVAFIPVFFFASEYAQVSLGKSSSEAGLLLLYYFAGFVVAAQIGGRLLDQVGAKLPVVLGSVVAAAGYFLWANKVTDLNLGDQVWQIVLTGAGMGMMLGPANTDAVNRASRLSYGEATGITQTVRNYAASLGLAVLGTTLVNSMRGNVTESLKGQGLPPSQADQVADEIAQGHGQAPASGIPGFIRSDFAESTRTVLIIMGAAMIAAALVALVGLRRGVQTETTPSTPKSAAAES
ncbi:MFS transporter [Kribbella amoyensis]|nr:MFS transporter [Kribbella amoyensis]